MTRFALNEMKQWPEVNVFSRIPSFARLFEPFFRRFQKNDMANYYMI